MSNIDIFPGYLLSGCSNDIPLLKITISICQQHEDGFNGLVCNPVYNYRQNEVKMMDVIKEVFLYLVFLYLLMMVSYGNRDPVTSKLYTSLYQEFHDADYIHGGVTLDSVC